MEIIQNVYELFISIFEAGKTKKKIETEIVTQATSAFPIGSLGLEQEQINENISYDEQVKYAQDHFNCLMALMEDKENIIENLILQYNVSQDMVGDNAEVDIENVRKDVLPSAYRAILECYDLNEERNELLDRNFHLRNEIYELVCLYHLYIICVMSVTI